QHMSCTYIQELLSITKYTDNYINVIFIIGATTEPAIVFRIFCKFMEERYGKKEADKLIYVTSYMQKGDLKQLADQKGYTSFVIPDDIGRRYSVLTPVCLLPMAAGGISLEQALSGARDAIHDLNEPDLFKNPAYQYAVARHRLYERGYTTEILANYEPKLSYFA